VTIRYQYAKADGHPDYTPGNVRMDLVWHNAAADELRFHTGRGFQLLNAKGTAVWTGKLWDGEHALQLHLDQSPADTTFRLRSIKDGFTQAWRRHDVVAALQGPQVVAAAASHINEPYVYGVTDCSWLTMVSVHAVEPSILLPHNAHLQRLSGYVHPITRSQVKPGDLVFIHNDAHVAIWLGTSAQHPGGPCVWDTEPSDTGAPVGWPTTHLGVGVRIRPAFGGYYCADINAFGRILAINGAP
jgi:hypothetical protein